MYKSNQVVFVPTETNKQGIIPAKIMDNCSYKTYRIRIYGDKADSFVSQYDIKPFNEELLANFEQNIDKRFKKLIKLLKMAVKQHKQFLQNTTPSLQTQKRTKDLQNLYCKQQDLMNQQNQIQSDGTQTFKNKYEAIKKTKVSLLLQQHKNNQTKTVLTYYHNNNNNTKTRTQCLQNIKTVLMLKFKFALQDLIFNIGQQLNQIIVRQIITANVFEMMDYVVTPMLYKINQYLENTKKSNRSKFKVMLVAHKEMVMKGLENYLENYGVFVEAGEEVRRVFKGL